MREWLAIWLTAMGVVGALTMPARAGNFSLTPAIQGQLDQHKATIRHWAAAPEILAAVKAQNALGPLPKMDNALWKILQQSDPVVKAFQANQACQFLRAKLAASHGAISEAFLSAAHGEKVAFAEKTSSYIHQGQAKFDVPFTTGEVWQGEPQFDESSQAYAIQIAAPVLERGKPISVLVVGLSLTSFSTSDGQARR